ncbi:MAG TPA: hypothetical protein PKD59_03465 [Miltoncostaeaceae bacterium]|nr:hypothetical protein [Miltoncostaeaceae bacterium]
MRRLLAATVIVLVAVFGVAACGDDDDDSGQAAAEAQVCTSLKGVQSAIDNVEGVQLRDPTANANNISLKRVKATWSGVEQAAKELSQADAEAVTSAIDGLESAVEDLPKPISVQQARTQLQPQLDAVKSAFAEMRNGINCS